MLSNLFKRFEQYDQSFDKSKRKSDQKLFKSRRIIPKTEFLQVWNYKVQVASKLKNEWAIRVQKVFELYKINPKLFLRSITFLEKNIFKTRCQVGILLLFFFWGWGGGFLNHVIFIIFRNFVKKIRAANVFTTYLMFNGFT